MQTNGFGRWRLQTHKEGVGDLANADHIDANELFVGNHYYPIADAIAALSTI